MSSPHVPSRHASPRPPSASTPGATGDSIPNGVSVRLMRLKVLYTFDDQNKTNCLARWPHAINVQVVYLEESTPIGILELKTCIQAIVAASPELVAQLGQDYTVYAYDYSEYETPLVGQGMLSWALASASPNPGAPAHQSRSLITGRVCTNILGIFSNGILETLEVKLRLVPVPTFLQSEYICSMEKYRELSRVIPKDFDASAWTAYLQANPDIGQLANRLAEQSQNERPGSRDGSGLELVSQLLSQGLLPNSTTDTSNSPMRYQLVEPARLPETELSGGNSGISSPAPSGNLETPLQSMVQANPSRPASRSAPRKSRVSRVLNLPRQEMLAPEETGGSRGQEEGPPKKRAKTTRANKTNKSSLASHPASLRVAASAAASIRVVRPIPVNPSVAGPGSTQEPPRAPTPRPTSTNGILQRPQPTARSNLGHDPFEQNRATLGYLVQPTDTIRASIETTMMSPESYRSGSASNTPINIASSPPVMSSPTPSSPGLPIMPREDSHMTKESFDDLFGEDDDDSNRNRESPGDNDKQTQSSPAKELFIQECTPGPPELLPTRMPPRTSGIQKKGMTRAESLAMSDAAETPEDIQQVSIAKQDILPKPRADASALPKLQPKPPSSDANKLPPTSRQVSRTASVGSLILPPVSASEPIQPPSNLRRSQSYTSGPGRQNHPMSEDSVTSKPSKSETSKVRSGSKRKMAIQTKLQAAIETGEIPPYCGNCGEIETPTWRKAWTKIFEYVDAQRLVQENEGGPIVAVEELQKDEAGNAISTRVVKKSLADGVDLGFVEILLCNPCGLWLNKFKNMRPQSQWEKDVVRKAHNKKKGSGKRKKNAVADEISEINTQSEADLRAECVSPQTRTFEGEKGGEDAGPTYSLPSPKKIRVQSVDKSDTISDRQEPLDKVAAAALRRAIQSSPARFLGTRNSPIDVENLGSTRRLLFSSPKNTTPKAFHREAQAGSQNNNDTASKGIGSEEGQTLDQSDDKENCPPNDDEDEVTNLIGDALDKRPSTPENDKSSPLMPSKTPSRITPKQIGLPPSPWRTFNFSPGGNDALPPPQTPSLGGLPLSAGQPSTEQSPFTRHLTQLLSEAHTFEMPSPSAGQESFDLPGFSQEDILAANLFMPSSPPPFFSLYEDPAEPSSGMWSDYNCPNSPTRDNIVSAYGLNLDGDESGGNDVQIAASEGLAENVAPTVDFSSFMQDVGQGKGGLNQGPTTTEEKVA
ncbi:MAG: hypothetical protein M1840_005029 [Geoglossum simile]|nr:MAG: hypothetical protein M1840_005029 [Geoglossum simile]